MADPNDGAESVTERRAARGAGGTPGGIGSFFVGLGMMLVGAYMILNQVVVHSHFSIWGLPGASGGGFGPLLIALMVGVGILFFRPTALWMTLVMFGLLSGRLRLDRAIIPSLSLRQLKLLDTSHSAGFRDRSESSDGDHNGRCFSRALL